MTRASLIQVAVWVGLVSCVAPDHQSVAPVEGPSAAAVGPEPGPEPEPSPADACVEIELDAALTAARADVEAERSETFEAHARALDQALACMSDGGERDRSQAASAATLEFELVERVHGPLDEVLGEAREPRRQACITNSEGVCVFRSSKRKAHAFDSSEPEDPTPLLAYDEVEQLRLAAHERYIAHTPASATRRARRYALIRLAMAHNDFERARPLLVAFVRDDDSELDAVWAAMMLTDLRSIDLTRLRWWSPDQPDLLDEWERRAVALDRWLDELPTLALWQHPEAGALRERVPMLRAGNMWQLGMIARDRGGEAGRRVDEATTDTPAPLPDPAEHFIRCAEIFIETYNTFEEHDKADTLLRNAADCYDAGYRPVAALEIRKALVARFPDSYHAMDALLHLAQGEEALALYADAGAHYLEFAATYRKSDLASAALLTAVRIADGIGDAELAREAERRYIELWTKRDRQRTAAFVWSRRPSEARALARYAEDYLKTFGTGGGVPRAVAAELALAEHRMAEACGHRLDEGLCVARRAPTLGSNCSLSGQPMPVVRARATRQLDGARGRLNKIIKTLRSWEPSGYQPKDLDEQMFLPSVPGRAALLRVDLELEDWLVAGLAHPEAEVRAAELDAAYAEVAQIQDPDVILRAFARRALIWEQFANRGLVRREGECVPLNQADIGYAERATQLYRECLEFSAQLRAAPGQRSDWFNDAARGCERALTHIEPEHTPPLTELFGGPGPNGSPGITSVGVVEDPWAREIVWVRRR